MNRKQAIAEIRKTYAILSDDIDRLYEVMFENQKQFMYRSMVRAFSAFIDGLLYQYRQIIIASNKDIPGIHSPNELSVLQEKRYTLSKKGELEARDSFEKFLPMLLFTLKQYPKLHGANFEPDTGDHRWADMKAFVTLRNTLSHPKNSDSLHLEESDIEAVQRAVDWFHDTTIAMHKVCDEADQAIRNASS